MCGIAGTLNFRGDACDEAQLARAVAALRHRGPDDQGVWTESHSNLSAGFAAVRLAILDPSSAGHQPMLVGNGRYVIAYNGEVYNFRALRGELAATGWKFTTEGDTEVVAAACAVWGKNALTRFNGMFALAFFDRTERRGFLARDRFGIKPLLVAQESGCAYFASEMSALRVFRSWDRGIDREALLHYVHFGYFAAPRTIYANARRLPPGSFRTFDLSGLGDAIRYAPADGGLENTQSDRQSACIAVRSALRDAVARRRVADVPLGAFLSGGLDSAIIATNLAECTPGPIETFSIGFHGQPRYDETRYARLMADQLGSTHHELRLGHDDVLREMIPVLEGLGEPFFDSSILPTLLVSRLARQHVTVCLSGDGGDELFGGYWRYLGHDAAASFQKLPAFARALVSRWIQRGAGVSKSSRWGNKLRQLRKLLRAGDESALCRHLRWSMLLDENSMTILRDPDAGSRVAHAMLAAADEVAGDRHADDLNRILAFDLRHALPGDMLHKVDFASMRESLEVRVPFLDPDVVAVAESCPAGWKIDRGMRKRLLIDAYRGHLPDAILDRDKMGFELPIGEFFRHELRDLFLSTVTADRLAGLEIFDPQAVMRLYDDHCERRGEYADLLFALLSLCTWRAGE